MKIKCDADVIATAIFAGIVLMLLFLFFCLFAIAHDSIQCKKETGYFDCNTTSNNQMLIELKK